MSRRDAPSPIVDTPAGLAEVVTHLREAGSFALDTEFVKERTFFAQLGIIQVATASLAAILDPRGLQDLGPFRELWTDAAVEKVVHSGVQDCEVLYVRLGAAPRNVFDTQIAAALLGYGDQISYAKLAAKVAGVRLAKLETRTDWTRRPLTPKQVQYALDDVRYLPQIRAHVGSRLSTMKREAWAAEEFRSLEDASTFAELKPEEAHHRLRVGSLSAKQRGALRELAAWREIEARRRDMPRGWVVSDGAIVEIARRLPRSAEALARVRGVDSKELERSGAAILAAVERGVLSPVTVPESNPGEETQETEALTRLLEAWLRARAQEAEVATSLLGSRNDVKALAVGHLVGSIPDSPLLSGWRREVIGQDLLDILEGRLRLRVGPEGRVIAERT